MLKTNLKMNRETETRRGTEIRKSQLRIHHRQCRNRPRERRKKQL